MDVRRAIHTGTSLEPAANVIPRPGAGPADWLATSSDPQFLVKLVDGVTMFAPGWYRFRACTGNSNGINAPCLYVDYGHGISERDRIPLPNPDEYGVIDAVVMLHSAVRNLRLDPTSREVAFTLHSVQFEQRSRAWAFGAMLATIVEVSSLPAWRVACGVLVRFVQRLATRGLRGAAGYLHRRYEAALNSVADDYQEWVRLYDTLDEHGIAALRARTQALVDGPLISVLVPTYNSPERWLRRALDSVIAQAYPKWELCIADDASPRPHVRRVLEEYAARDARIRVSYRARNGHISAASNTALEMARGQLVALLDHDDELPPHALLEVAEAAQRHPEWKLIYSDEDKIDERGRRFDPYFKPDWNYDLLLGQNCISHLGVYHTSAVRAVGGFREGFEGSQDWDLALRVIEGLAPGQVGHIPRILYHWRAISGSTALGLGEKNYALDAGRRAVAEHLQRMGCEAEVAALPAGHLRVHRRLPEQPPRVSLVIPTRDKVELLRICVQSILERTDYSDYEILVVDNQSIERETLDYFEEIGRRPNIRVLRYDQPFNYSAINNHAITLASGSVIGLINNDIEVISPDWLQEMVGQALRPDVGAVGAMLYYPDDTIQHAGVLLGFGGIAGHMLAHNARGCPGQMSRARLTQELSAVTAACLVARRSVLQQVGGLDERLQVAFNDVDLCLRLREAGYRNIWTPFAELYHHESASRGYEDTPEKVARFHREIDFMRVRWGSALAHDPAYNPNLTLTDEPFALAFPPRLA